MTTLTIAPYTLPGALLGPENPLPYFRDPAVHLTRSAHASLPEEKRATLGWEAAFRVLPYRMQDAYTRVRASLTFRSIVLENEVLRATFLPEMGGRLVSLIYTPEQRELLHRNPVFQPADLAIRNAWFSGGIEWNIGQLGHTFSTCSPLFAAAIRDGEGSPGLRLYEFERAHGLFWQIDFSLPPGSPFLIAYTRVTNPFERPTSMYWWTNIAVDEREGVRVLAPAQTALAPFPGEGFGQGQLPYLAAFGGKDATYSLNSPHANEFFFQCDEAEMPFEAALDRQGKGLVEASTRRLRYRKMFCWGFHRGGRHWQEFLSQPGEAYLEIQAGLAPTQLHGLLMPAQTAWDWTQVFGYLHAPAEGVHSPIWKDAWTCAQEALFAQMTPTRLEAIEAGCRARADQEVGEILQVGSGWGALELMRRSLAPGVDAALEKGLLPRSGYPQSALSQAQAQWMGLLRGEPFPTPDPVLEPGEWMVQAEWERRIEAAIQASAEPNWFALLHLGVMRLEHFDEDGARAAWGESLRAAPSLWAWRNLGALETRQGHAAAALECYQQGFDLARGQVPVGFAVEYMQILFENNLFEQGLKVFADLPTQVKNADRVQIWLARLALQTGDLDTLEALLRREFAIMREGEGSLTDLWVELHSAREALRQARPVDDALRAEVRNNFPPPASIDFRNSED